MEDERPPGRARRVVGSTGRGIKRAGTATGSAASYTFRQARRASHAEGAGDSGLYRLIELHAFNAAGDAAVAISLAGTLFFAQPGEARGQVALFLFLTMLPFAVVAPLLGPFLDRFSHGRRWAIGGTMAIRAFLCWLMADAVASQSIAMFPTALGVLVSSKAYGVARAATVPRLQPTGLTLVKANSRISLAGVVGAAVAAPLAGAASTFGAQWSLRFAFVIFAAATILSILLPAKADAHAGELPVSLTGDSKKFRVPVEVIFALRCNAGLRMLSGFLTMYMAFLLRNHPLPGWEHRTTLLLALVIGAAGLGNTIGIGLGSVLRKVTPAVTVVVALLADATAAVIAAVFYGLIAADRARTDRGGRTGHGQAGARRHRPARRARAPPHLRVRTLGDPAAAVLGARRLHRDRPAAGDRQQGGSRARPRCPGRADRRLDRLRAEPALRTDPSAHSRGHVGVGAGRPPGGGTYSSSSSARPRSSLAVGLAVFASGWRPAR